MDLSAAGELRAKARKALQATLDALGRLHSAADRLALSSEEGSLMIEAMKPARLAPTLRESVEALKAPTKTVEELLEELAPDGELELIGAKFRVNGVELRVSSIVRSRGLITLRGTEVVNKYDRSMYCYMPTSCAVEWTLSLRTPAVFVDGFIEPDCRYFGQREEATPPVSPQDDLEDEDLDDDEEDA